MNIWVLWHGMKHASDGFYCQVYASYALAEMVAWKRLAYSVGENTDEMKSKFALSGGGLSAAIEFYSAKMHILRGKVQSI